jgi:hypothetical protein
MSRFLHGPPVIRGLSVADRCYRAPAFCTKECIAKQTNKQTMRFPSSCRPCPSLGYQVKKNSSLYLIKHRDIRTYGGVDVDLLGTGWKWVVSFRPPELVKGPIHDQSSCAKLFCATQVCPFTIKSISTIHDQSCCATLRVAQLDWSCMGPLTSSGGLKLTTHFHPVPRRSTSLCHGA